MKIPVDLAEAHNALAATVAFYSRVMQAQQDVMDGLQQRLHEVQKKQVRLTSCISRALAETVGAGEVLAVSTRLVRIRDILLDDPKNQTGSSGDERGGQAAVEAKPDDGRG